MTGVLLENLTGLRLVKKFPAYYGTRRFITAVTSARHLSLSWDRSIQSIPPHPTSWRSVLILSSHLCLGLPSGLFPSGFPHQNSVYASPLHHTRYMPGPSHLLDFITRTIFCEQYRSWSSSLCSFLQLLVTSSLPQAMWKIERPSETNGICHTACEQDQDVPSWSCSQAVRLILLLCVQWKTPDDGQRNCPKHVEF